MTRDALHQLIDELPEQELAATAALLDAVRRNDRFLLQFLLAEEVDPEPGELEELGEFDPNDLVEPDEMDRIFGRV